MFRFIRVNLVAFSLLLAACARNSAAPPTAAITPTLPPPKATSTSTPSVTSSLPAFTPAPATSTPTPTPEPPCTNDARFLGDVTVPDGAQFLPGQAVNKKWSVKNAGTCDWGPDYRLVLVSGDSMGAPSEVAVYPARAGTTATWELQMTAPQDPGSYTGKWQARDPEGNLFGSLVFIKIEVIPLPATATP